MRSLPFLLAASALFGIGVSVFIAKQSKPMLVVSPGDSLKAADLHARRADNAADDQALVMLRKLRRTPKRATFEELTLAEVEWLAADQRQREQDAQTAAEATAAADDMPDSENDDFSDSDPTDAVAALADQLQESGQADSQDITTTMALAEEAGVDPEELAQELIEREAADSNDATAPLVQPSGPAAENAGSVEALPEAAIAGPAQPAAPTNGL